MQCDVDLTAPAPPSDDSRYFMHEYCDIFTINAHYCKRNRKGLLDVPSISFQLPMEDGDTFTDFYDRNDESLQECIERVTEGVYELDKEKTPPCVWEEKKRIVEASVREAAKEERARKESVIDNFSSRDDCYFSELDVKIYQVYPLNFPAEITGQLPNKFYRPFDVTVISTWDEEQSLHLPIDFPFDTEPDSPLGVYLQIRLVDFLAKTGYLHLSRNEVFKVFGVERIAHYLGCPKCSLPLYSKCIQRLVASLAKNVRKVGRIPKHASDFLLCFVFSRHGALGIPRDTFATSLRLNGDDPSQLELCLDGADSFLPVGIIALSKFISDEAIENTLLDLLVNNGRSIPVPAGRRESDVPADCFKQCLLSLPDDVLSPEGKRRVKLALPDHEIPLRTLKHHLDTSVKTIAIKICDEKDLKKTAMTSTDMMIGEFGNGTRNHSVLIDGRQNLIIDPVESFGTVERTSAGLQELGISDFHFLRSVKRTELSEKSRRRLEKKTQLPWIHGSSIADHDSDEM